MCSVTSSSPTGSAPSCKSRRSTVTPDAAAELLASPHTLVGLGDAGAHVMSITNFGYPSQVLAQFVRDDGRVRLETAINRMTARPAEVLGIPDRGQLRAGFAADIVVVDLARLRLGPLRVAHDLPGASARLYQDAEGYRAVAVNGTVTIEDDRPTGARPGRLMKAAVAPRRPAPTRPVDPHRG